MKVFLNDQFEVLGYVKPGASSKSLMELVKSDIGKLTMDDFLIMSSGSNDAKRNDLRKVFPDVISVLNAFYKINVILVSISYRYDLTSSHINSEIINFYRKLCKLAKIFSHVNVIEVDNKRQLFTTHGLHLNRLGKELLSSHLLFHIYSALEVGTGSLIALAWRDGYLQGSPPPAISDNQDLITNNIIWDKLVSIPCSVKESSASCAVNGNINIDNPRLLKTRTSTRVKKARNNFFMVKSDSRLISNATSSCDGPNYLNFKMIKGQLSHIHLGKSIFLSSKESSKNLSTAALQFYHQNIQGLRCKIDEILNFLHPDIPHILCLSEHHLDQLEPETVHLGNYNLGASYCRRSMKKGGVCIYVHCDLSYSKIDLSNSLLINILKQVQFYYQTFLIIFILNQFTELLVVILLFFYLN
jgi:hypothetical protein